MFVTFVTAWTGRAIFSGVLDTEEPQNVHLSNCAREIRQPWASCRSFWESWAKEIFGKKKREVSHSSVSTEEIDAVVEARVEARVNEVVDARVDAVVGERVAAQVDAVKASFQSHFEWMTSQLHALQASQRTTSTGVSQVHLMPTKRSATCTSMSLIYAQLLGLTSSQMKPPFTGYLSRMIKWKCQLFLWWRARIWHVFLSVLKRSLL